MMNIDTMDSGDLGKKGEVEFQRIAEAAKFIVNKSRDNDSAGWDWVLNDRLMLIPNRSIDNRPAPLTCVIQIKTKWENNTSFELKLSAAEQLAKDPKPSFILCILVNRDTEEITKSYLIHLLDDNLEKILAALRKEAANPTRNLNHSYIYFNPRTEGVDFQFNKRGIRSALEELCGPDTTAYSVKKADQLQSLGVNRHSVELKVAIKSSEAEIIDFFLGKDSQIPATIESITETRFNIPFELDGFPKHGVLTFKQNPSEKCEITLRSRNNSLISRFKGDLYLAPSSLKFSRNRPFRIVSTFFEITVKDDLFNLKAIDIAADHSRYNIETWISMSKSLVILHSGGGRIEIRLHGRIIADGTMPPSPQEENIEYWKHRLKFLNNVKEILEITDAPSEFLMSPAELSENYEQLSFIHQVIFFGLSDRTISHELQSTEEIPSYATTISYTISYFKADRSLLFWSAKLTMNVARINAETLLCTAKTAEIIDLDIIHENEYRDRTEKIKKNDDAGILMAKSGFGVNEGENQIVRIDFVADLNSSTPTKICDTDALNSEI